jgi:hypothetical protein
MDDQRGQGYHDEAGEPPLIGRVAAQMPVERVIDRMNCPSDDERDERDADAVDHISESSTLTPMPIWKAPTSCSRCWLYGGKSMKASKERGNSSDQTPKISMKPPTTIAAMVTNALCQGFG